MIFIFPWITTRVTTDCSHTDVPEFIMIYSYIEGMSHFDIEVMPIDVVIIFLPLVYPYYASVFIFRPFFYCQ